MSGALRAGDAVARIAVWSGPRSISTALMRSFGERPDTAVVDEPFYAAWLRIAGAKHPMRDEILAAQETDWRRVAEALTAPPPDGRRIVYQKHMTHHMVPDIGLDWMRACRHAFLIRAPARVIASYAEKREAVTLKDLGLARQVELFEEASRIAGAPPPVVDADRLLADPRGVLRAFCEALAIPFDPNMLAWPPGRRATDGVWAAHWYDAVERSTGFASPRPLPALRDPSHRRLEAEALPFYERLAAHALAPVQ
jgi:hypothetical protein